MTRLLLILFLFIITSSLYAQKEKIKFYYTINDKIYEGSFMVSYKVYDDVKNYSTNGVIDYDRYDASTVKILAKVSNLEWQSPYHADSYRLAFTPEILEAGDGLSLDTKFTQYLEVGMNRKIHYTPDPYISVSTPTGVSISCLVVKNDFNPDTRSDDIDDALSSGDFVGLAMTIKPLMLVPNSETSSDEEVLFMWELYEAVIRGADEGLVNLSYRIAEVIKEGSFKDASKYFKSPPSANVDVFDKPPPVVEKRNPDQEAFVAAKRRNTISAYQSYLSEFPYGDYKSNARDRIIRLTPFEYNQSRNGSRILITFTAGVGSSHPALTFSNNDDYAIKYNWFNAKEVEIDLPEERSTRATFTLGTKELKLDLENTFAPFNASMYRSGQRLIISNISGGKAPYTVSINQRDQQIYTAEIHNNQEYSLDLSQLPLHKGYFMAKVLDVREETAASVNEEWEQDNANARTAYSSGSSRDTDQTTDYSWFLLIPIFAGLFFLLYRRYVGSF